MKIKTVLILLLATAFTLALAACGGGGSKDPFETGHEPADVSGYEGVQSTGEPVFYETTVKDVVKLMDRRKTFCFIAAFSDCPSCRALMPELDEAARKAGRKVGLINTRKDPSWKNNTDIDDYDLFCKRFGEYLEKDEDGRLHLYTPDTYFIKDGEVVGRHSGVTKGADDPEKELTDTQREKLAKELDNDFKALTTS